MTADRIRVFRSEPSGLGTAVQWRSNGDHPLDGVGQWIDDPLAGKPYQRLEGAVVRFYRLPDGVDGEQICRKCGQRMEDHGWIDRTRPDRLVHPGDWVTIPEHGIGAFNHGYDRNACGDDCNNGECRAGQAHDRCTLECLIDQTGRRDE